MGPDLIHFPQEVLKMSRFVTRLRPDEVVGPAVSAVEILAIELDVSTPFSDMVRSLL